MVMGRVTMATLAALSTSTSRPCTYRTGIERKFLCSDGLELAAKYWSSLSLNHNPTSVRTSPAESDAAENESKKFICLHGWLDNCASFHILSPSIVNRLSSSSSSSSSSVDVEVLALDFPGHGLSGHRSPDCPMSLLSEYCFYACEAAEQLQWDKFSLIGHSMGAGVSVILASAWPEKVESLVLLEGLGPMTCDAKDSSKHVRRAVEKRMRSNKTLYNEDGTKRGSRVYKNIDMAINARVLTAKRSLGGHQYVSREAATLMVERAIVQADTKTSDSSSSSVSFRHDPRLNWPSLQYTTPAQLEAYWHNIDCPTMLVQADDGWPVPQAFADWSSKHLKLHCNVKLPGSHHNHADPDTADAVADNVVTFLEEYLIMKK